MRKCICFWLLVMRKTRDDRREAEKPELGFTSLVYRLAFLRLALSQVRLRPAQSILSFRGRLVFAADPALIADFINVAEQKDVIDFAGPRPVTARRICGLHLRDQL